jgi:hypothetical protein
MVGRIFGSLVGLLMIKMLADALEKEERDRLGKKKSKGIDIKIPRMKI